MMQRLILSLCVWLALAASLFAAADLDGNDAYDLTSHNWPTASSTRTVAFWVYITDVSNRQELIYTGAEFTNQRCLIENTSSGALQLGFLGHSAISSSSITSSGTWMHVAYTVYSSSSYEVFLNGSSVATGSGGINTGSAVNIGGGHASIANLTGYICEVGVWNVQLGSASLAALAKGVSPKKIRTSNLVSYAPLVRDAVMVRGSATISANGDPTVATHPRVYP